MGRLRVAPVVVKLDPYFLGRFKGNDGADWKHTVSSASIEVVEWFRWVWYWQTSFYVPGVPDRIALAGLAYTRKQAIKRATYAISGYVPPKGHIIEGRNLL